MKLLVLDGNSIVNRAFYGIKLLTTKSGEYTNAIYGFLNILLKLEDVCTPDAVAVAFDVHAPTFRHKMYDEYKAELENLPTKAEYDKKKNTTTPTEAPVETAEPVQDGEE